MIRMVWKIRVVTKGVAIAAIILNDMPDRLLNNPQAAKSNIKIGSQRGAA